MFRWLLFCVALCAGAFALVNYGVPMAQELGWINKDDQVIDDLEGATTNCFEAAACQ